MGFDALGLLNTGVSAATAGLNYYSQMQTNQLNKEMQEKEWQREDNAVQRRVKDLVAAGLNPVLAASGQGAQSSLTTHFGAPQLGKIDLQGIYQAGILKEQQNIAEHDSEITKQKAIQEEYASSVARRDATVRNAINDYKLHSLDGQGIPVITRLAQNEILRNISESDAAASLARKAAADADESEYSAKLRKMDYDNYYLNLGVGVLKGLAGAVASGATASKLMQGKHTVEKIITKSGADRFIDINSR